MAAASPTTRVAASKMATRARQRASRTGFVAKRVSLLPSLKRARQKRAAKLRGGADKISVYENERPKQRGSGARPHENMISKPSGNEKRRESVPIDGRTRSDSPTSPASSARQPPGFPRHETPIRNSVSETMVGHNLRTTVAPPPPTVEPPSCTTSLPFAAPKAELECQDAETHSHAKGAQSQARQRQRERRSRSGRLPAAKASTSDGVRETKVRARTPGGTTLNLTYTVGVCFTVVCCPPDQHPIRRVVRTEEIDSYRRKHQRARHAQASPASKRRRAAFLLPLRHNPQHTYHQPRHGADGPHPARGDDKSQQTGHDVPRFLHPSLLLSGITIRLLVAVALLVMTWLMTMSTNCD
ncbi:uncharacterized protein LOC119400535 [Rhipicephalus sanguineus]|uniref:uncharacterized protein LOC119400535 n=1 Tax=Rhipicephalus sanguineus TaxID=34632 RepID=UPI0020C3C162|nr:uncharacterized protein LOC119400535 [Rhipicephalus sanguineus]